MRWSAGRSTVRFRLGARQHGVVRADVWAPGALLRRVAAACTCVTDAASSCSCLPCAQISDWRRDYSWKPGQEPQPDEDGPETYLAQRWARGCCLGANGRTHEAACSDSAASAARSTSLRRPANGLTAKLQAQGRLPLCPAMAAELSYLHAGARYAGAQTSSPKPPHGTRLPLPPTAATHTLVPHRYLEAPYLVGGKKFDLRIYALVTSYSPLRIFLHRWAQAAVSVSRSPCTAERRCTQ